MIAFIKLSPIIILAGLMMASNIGDLGLDILIIAPITTVYAALIAIFTEKYKLSEIVDAAVDRVKEEQLVFFILMLAYGMAEAFMATGVGAAIINVALNFGITGKTVALAAFYILYTVSGYWYLLGYICSMCACFLMAKPHSWWGSSSYHMCHSCVDHACDNIGLISDTTVVSSGIQGVEVIHRVRHQGVWSLLCLLLAAIMFLISSLGLPSEVGSAVEAIEQIPEEVYTVLTEERPSAVNLLNQVKEGVPFYMVIPLILVLVVAVMGFPTLVCLGLGIISSYIFGMIAGTIDNTHEFLDLMYTGFSEAGSWVIVMMMWVGAFGSYGQDGSL